MLPFNENIFKFTNDNSLLHYIIISSVLLRCQITRTIYEKFKELEKSDNLINSVQRNN